MLVTGSFATQLPAEETVTRLINISRNNGEATWLGGVNRLLNDFLRHVVHTRKVVVVNTARVGV